MPIYEFVCEACARVSEHMQKVSDPPPAACPACGQGPLVKAVSRTSFQLRGGGWYSDLYASRKPDAPAGPAGEGAAKAEPKAAEPKPTEKTADKTAPAAKPAASPGGGAGTGGGTPAPS